MMVMALMLTVVMVAFVIKSFFLTDCIDDGSICGVGSGGGGGVTIGFGGSFLAHHHHQEHLHHQH